MPKNDTWKLSFSFVGSTPHLIGMDAVVGWVTVTVLYSWKTSPSLTLMPKAGLLLGLLMKEPRLIEKVLVHPLTSTLIGVETETSSG
jgi:hypothetical protein